MTVFILGGSNSILRDGWTRAFSQASLDEPVINLSIGATHSVTGLYRALFTAEIKPGDVVLWEYCLNDINQLQRSPLRPAALAAYLEILLSHCAEHDIRVSALLLKNWPEARSGRERRYRTLVKEVFSSWGIPFCDAEREFCASRGQSGLDRSDFRDKQHYASDSDFMDFLRMQGPALVRSAKTPARAERRFSRPGRGIAFFDNWTGAEPELTGTSLVRMPAWSLDNGLTLKAPQDGLLVGVALYIHAHGGAMEIMSGEQSVTIAANFRAGGEDPNVDKHRLATVYCAVPGQKRFRIKAGDDIKVRWLSQGDVEAYQELGNRVLLNARQLRGNRARLLGLLVETDGGLGAR